MHLKSRQTIFRQVSYRYQSTSSATVRSFNVCYRIDVFFHSIPWFLCCRFVWMFRKSFKVLCSYSPVYSFFFPQFYRFAKINIKTRRWIEIQNYLNKNYCRSGIKLVTEPGGILVRVRLVRAGFGWPHTGTILLKTFAVILNGIKWVPTVHCGTRFRAKLNSTIQHNPLI